MTHSQENGSFPEWLPAPPLACCFIGMVVKSIDRPETGLVSRAEDDRVAVRYKDRGAGWCWYNESARVARLVYSPVRTFPVGSRVKHLHRRPGSRCLGSVTSHKKSGEMMQVKYDDGSTGYYDLKNHHKLRLYNIPEHTLVEATNPYRKGMVSGRTADGTIKVVFANGEEHYPRHTHHKIKPRKYLGDALAEAEAEAADAHECKRKRRREDQNQNQNQKVPFSVKFRKKVEEAKRGLKTLCEDDWHDSDSEEDDGCGMFEEGVDGDTFC